MRRGVTAFKFQPMSRKQKKVLSWWRSGSPYAGYDGIIADGSIRSGKTIVFILSFILWSTHEFASGGYNFIISGRTIGALKRNVVSPMLRILKALRIAYEYNRSENYLIFGNNTYYLFGADNEASQDVVQGLTAAGWLADEIALHHPEFITQALGRLLSIPNSLFWWNCNPESPYHIVNTEYILKACEKYILHLHFTLDDNLTLSQKAKERAKRMFFGVFYKRYILGLWVAAEGAIYDMFDEAVHVVDKLPEMVRYWVTCDYGTTNPTVFLLIGQGTDNRFYVVDEWRWDSVKEHRQMTDGQYSDALHKFIISHSALAKLQWIFIDPSAASFRLQVYNDHKDLRARLIPANNSVLDGIRRVSTLLSTPLLFMHRRCKGLDEELSGYVWDPKAQERGEDAPVKQNDHAPDALRYWANGTRNVWEPILKKIALQTTKKAA
ncbi:PBSX family phage terminase large subunit [bacterium]|nr:PBSX family phage terminase large subunit [bacterium]